MIAGIVSLCLAYVLSQFFRSFLAVPDDPEGKRGALQKGFTYVAFALQGGETS